MVCYTKRGAFVSTSTIDWRLIVGLIFIFLILFSRSPQTDIVGLAIGAGWMFSAGLAPWRGRNPLGSTKVTYWRGERVVTRTPARIRAVSPLQAVLSLWFLALGLGMAYAALRIFILLVS
jgi:hypothetical protein